MGVLMLDVTSNGLRIRGTQAERTITFLPPKSIACSPNHREELAFNTWTALASGTGAGSAMIK
jgi:hypothetical protein